MNQHGGPDLELRDLVESALGKKAVAWRTPHTGLSGAHRFVVGFADGSGAFVKAAVDDETEGWLRTEQRILREVKGDFVPREVAGLEGAKNPALVTEDLSRAHWPTDHHPVHWAPGHFDLLLETLKRLRAVEGPQWLPATSARSPSQWRSIEREADRFLALQICPESWFREALDGLIEAEESLSLEGHSLVHNDVRSDNLCIIRDRVVLVDWSVARRGHPDHDLAAVVCTLPLEGGPDPVVVMPDGGAWASYHTAIASKRAYRDARAPDWLTVVLRRMTAISLKWASQSLDLPPWTGVEWSEIR